MSTTSEKSILTKLSCGCLYMIPTNRRRLSRAHALQIYEEARADGVYCFMCKEMVKPVKLIKISG